MKRLLPALLLLLSLSSLATAQTPWRGEWLGRFPDMQVRIFFRIDTATSTGAAYDVSWASPNQGMPIQSVETSRIDRDSIHLTFSTPVASFDGKLDTKNDAIEGTWTQGGGSAPLTLYRAHDYNAPMVVASEGRIDSLHLTLAITANAGERLATLYSPDQGEQLVPASHVYDSAGMFRMVFPRISARFDGNYSSDRSHLNGVFYQRGEYRMSFVRSVLPIWIIQNEPVFTPTSSGSSDTSFEGTIKETFIYPVSNSTVPRQSWYKGGNILFRMGDLSNEKKQRITKINTRTHMMSERYFGSRERSMSYTVAPSDSVVKIAKEVLRPTGRTHVIRDKVCMEYYSIDTDRGETITNLWWLTADYSQKTKNAILTPLLTFNRQGSGLAAIVRMQQLNMVPVEYQVVSASGIVLIATMDAVQPGPVEATVFSK